jgi:hypothetical protein
LEEAVDLSSDRLLMLTESQAVSELIQGSYYIRAVYDYERIETIRRTYEKLCGNV